MSPRAQHIRWAHCKPLAAVCLLYKLGMRADAAAVRSGCIGAGRRVRDLSGRVRRKGAAALLPHSLSRCPLQADGAGGATGARCNHASGRGLQPGELGRRGCRSAVEAFDSGSSGSWFRPGGVLPCWKVGGRVAHPARGRRMALAPADLPPGAHLCCPQPTALAVLPWRTEHSVRSYLLQPRRRAELAAAQGGSLHADQGGWVQRHVWVLIKVSMGESVVAWLLGCTWDRTCGTQPLPPTKAELPCPRPRFPPSPLCTRPQFWAAGCAAGWCETTCSQRCTTTGTVPA